MFRSLVVLAALSLTLGANAQSIDFDPPSAAIASDNAIVIVFNEGIQTPDAQALVESIQPESFSVAFRPVTVSIRTDRALTEQELSILKAEPDFVRIWSVPLEGSPQNPTPGVHHTISLSPWLSVEQARAIAMKVDVIADGAITKSPNEIEVRLKSSASEIVANLEKRPEVKYVAYLSAE